MVNSGNFVNRYQLVNTQSTQQISETRFDLLRSLPLSPKMNITNLDDMINFYVENADDIAKKYLSRPWWEDQLLAASDKENLGIVMDEIPEDNIFCKEYISNYMCLELGLKKRYLNPQLSANLSYAAKFSKNDNFRWRVVQILQTIFDKLHIENVSPVPDPSLSSEDIRNVKVEFWAIDKGEKPNWFDDVYNPSHWEGYGVDEETLKHYAKILFGAKRQNEIITHIRNKRSLNSVVRGLLQFIENVRRAQIPQQECQRILVTSTYKELPYGSVVLYLNPSDPSRVRMEWIFRFPIYMALNYLNPKKQLLKTLPRLNSVLIPAILEFLSSDSPHFPSFSEVNTIYVDPVGLQSDYLQNYYLFVWDTKKSGFYPCNTIDSGFLSSKLKFQFRD